MRGSDELNDEDKEEIIIKVQPNLSQSSRVQPNEEIALKIIPRKAKVCILLSAFYFTLLLFLSTSTMRSSHVGIIMRSHSSNLKIDISTMCVEIVKQQKQSIQLNKHVNNILNKQQPRLSSIDYKFLQHMNLTETLRILKYKIEKLLGDLRDRLSDEKMEANNGKICGLRVEISKLRKRLEVNLKSKISWIGDGRFQKIRCGWWGWRRCSLRTTNKERLHIHKEIDESLQIIIQIAKDTEYRWNSLCT